VKVKGNILFKEEQYFRVKWLWGIIILSMLSCVGVILGLAFNDKEKTKEAWAALVIVIPLEAIIAYLMFITKLQTVLTTEGLHYSWSPFQRSYRFIPVNNIEKTELRHGPALSYGYHWVPGYGKVHNVGPGNGIQFTLKNGKKIFIGTQKQAAFQNAVDKMIGSPKRI
jgi:hypothetical protein